MVSNPGDKLVRPVNAPSTPGAQAGYGVQPGTSQAVVIANQVIIIGPGGGEFVYSGKPAAGNLVASNTGLGSPALDPYGLNMVQPGVVNYQQQTKFGTGYLATELTGGGIVVAYNETYTGAYTTFATILASLAAELWVIADLGVEITGGPLTATAGTAGSPSLITTDSWHSISPGGDWTASGDGVNGFYARLLSTGDYLLAWDVLNNDANPGTLGAVPTPPATDVYLQSGWAGTGPTSYNDGFSPGFKIAASTGDITGIGLFVGTLRMYGTAILPMGSL